MRGRVRVEVNGGAPQIAKIASLTLIVITMLILLGAGVETKAQDRLRDAPKEESCKIYKITIVSPPQDVTFKATVVVPPNVDPTMSSSRDKGLDCPVKVKLPPGVVAAAPKRPSRRGTRGKI